MTMIEKNIFRPLPTVKKSNLACSETGVEAEDQVEQTDGRASGAGADTIALIGSEADREEIQVLNLS